MGDPADYVVHRLRLAGGLRASIWCVDPPRGEWHWHIEDSKRFLRSGTARTREQAAWEVFIYGAIEQAEREEP